MSTERTDARDDKTRYALECARACSDNLRALLVERFDIVDDKVVPVLKHHSRVDWHRLVLELDNVLSTALVSQWFLGEWIFMRHGRDPTALLDNIAAGGMAKFKSNRQDPDLLLLDDFGLRDLTKDPDA